MALAQEVAAKGVTVNTVSPGYIDSAKVQASDAQSASDEIIRWFRFGRWLSGLDRPHSFIDNHIINQLVILVGIARQDQ